MDSGHRAAARDPRPRLHGRHQPAQGMAGSSEEERDQAACTLPVVE